MSPKFYKLSLLGIFLLYLLASVAVSLGGLDGFVGAFSMFASFDEVYSIKEVYNILASDSIKELFLSVAAGKGYIYGRFIYMVNAVICYVPYKIFGIEGLVFALRMAHCLYLFFGFWLIVEFVNTNKVNRVLSLVLLLILPVTLYFMGIAKPEPMQLLLLGLFFKFQSKYNWAWLLLGLALGSKISIAFSVLFLGLFEVIEVVKSKNIRPIWEKGIWALIGLFIALPGLILSIFYPFFRKGLVNIVATTKKPYDDASIGLMDWVHKWMTYFYELPAALSYMIMLLLLVSSIWLAFRHKQKLNYIVFAYAAILPIMLLTKRMWGHYLFLGTAMLLPFIFEFIDTFKSKFKWKYLVFAIVCVQFYPHLKGIQNAVVESKKTAYLETKANTLEVLDKVRKAENQQTIGVDLMLYHSYEWVSQSDIIMCSKDVHQDCDLLILPEENEYVLDESFKLLEASKGIVVYKR
jgi:hypothetical protein